MPGSFGHSLGGATAAATMLDDSRIKAGIDMDGTLLGPVVTTGLDKPFMLLSNATHNRNNDSSWAQFWNAGLTPTQLAGIIGTIDPARAITVEEAYVDSFFNLHLRGQDNDLLDGPSPLFPEMVPVP